MKPALVTALLVLVAGEARAAGDLDVTLISRTPRIDYVWNAADPTREGWPSPGQAVTWQAHVKAWGRSFTSVPYRFILDGAEVARGRVDVPAGDGALVDFVLPWTFARRELRFEVDPDNEIAEDEEGNDALTVHTDALAVGFYVERGLYDHFQANQHRLAGARSNSFEDWAQRHVRRFNEMAARAIYPETPDGVLDRMRLDEVVVVPDGALPLVPLTDLHQQGADGHTHPNLADRNVDLLWGFATADLAVIYSDVVTPDETGNAFFYQGSLLHELGHARYLVDTYGWWVRDGQSGDEVNILENGVRVAGSALMPGTGLLHFSSGQGLMTQTYGFIDRHSAAALNLIAHRRATRGNSNEPENIGVYLNDLPAENRVTVRDAGGTPIADADVWIYRAVGGKPFWFTKVFDDVPDMRLRTDAQGRVLVGRCPFSADGRIVHEFGASNVTAIVRVAKGSTVAYGFLESLGFNLAYWGGRRALADHDLVVGKECSFSRPYPTVPAYEGTVTRSPVTLEWRSVFGATGYEVWAGTDGGPARLLGTTSSGSRTSLVAALSGRVTWWVAAKFPGCQSILSGLYVFTVLPVSSFAYAPAAPRPSESVDFIGHVEGGPATFAWSFGDGGTATAARASHAYAQPGNYEVTLTATTTAGSHTSRRTISVATETFTTSFFVPIALSKHGAAGSFYTTEMGLTNRGATDARVAMAFTDAERAGDPPAVAEEVLPAGRQVVVADVVARLREKGAALAAGDVVGTLRVTFEGLSAPGVAAVTLRTTTPVGGGRAGLAYTGLRDADLLDGPAHLCGLRQDAQDRSNVAVQNAGRPGDGPITLRLTATSGDGRMSAPLGEPTLAPGQLFQVSGALAVFGAGATGTVKVERISGTARFYAYGVINDQVTSDGSFVPPVPEVALTASQASVTGWVLPVAVETSSFSTEVVVANLTETARTVTLALGPHGTSGEVTLSVSLAPFAQSLIPDFIQELRERGTGTVEARGATITAPVFATDATGDARGLALGARVSSPGAGGRLGIFTPAVASGVAGPEAVWLHGLRQDAENRTNVAFVAVSDAATASLPETFGVEVFDGDTGARVAVAQHLVTVGPRRFEQVNNLLYQLAPGTANAYVRVTRSGGTDPFVTYAVINDGARPHERSDDGAVVPGVP